MKRTFLIFSLFMLLAAQPVQAADAPSVSAKAAIVYHPASGQVLWARNARDKRLIASTTKIMTAIVAIEQCDLEDTVTITPEMANVEGSSMYLQAGKDYTVEELLYGLMLASGNDAATAIALHTAGSEAAFAELMNEKALMLQLTDTHFENPHGLDSAHHYSTAYDMARLAGYAMENSTFREIVGTWNTNIQGLTYVNHNRLLWQCEGVIGVKTGYTKAAGRTLVTCCERDGERLICVTLSDPNDWIDHMSLYDWAYARYQSRLLLSKDTRFMLPILTGGNTQAPVEPLRDVTVFGDENVDASYVVELPRVGFGPVHAGDTAGRVLVKIENKIVGEVPLVYMENYRIEKKPALEKFFSKSG